MKPILKTLANGVRVLVIPQPAALTATALVLVGTGSVYESKDENGLSHFLEHMCFKGTDTLPNAKVIAESFERIGAISNAFTSSEYTGYYAKGGPGNIPTFLEVLSDIYLNSTLPDAEIQKERGVIIEEINMYEDQPAQKVGEALLRLMYGDQPAGWNIAGTKENVLRFTRDDFVQYKSKHYHADNTVVVISGAVDAKTVYQQIQKLFDSLEQSKTTKKQKVRVEKTCLKLDVIHKALDQAHIAIGFHALPFGHKDRIAVSLLATILGRGLSSRLAQVLREELGAAYYVGAGNDTHREYGLFEISAGIDKSRITEIFERIAALLIDIKTTLVPPDELHKAVEYSLGMQRLGLESSDDLAGFYAVQLMMGQDLKTPADLERQYRAVTSADIRRVARTLFTTLNTSIAVIGPYEPKDIDTRAFISL